MLRDKTHGAIPLGAADLTPAELAPHLVRLQLERVELNTTIDGLRFRRDELAGKLRHAKASAEAEARRTLDPARGKTAPAASAVKAFVDEYPAVLDVKEAQAEVARDLAAADDRAGQVRSGLRVILSLIAVAHRTADAAALEAKIAGAGEDW